MPSRSAGAPHTVQNGNRRPGGVALALRHTADHGHTLLDFHRRYLAADGPRSTALISLLVYNGLRISEALACDIEHFTHQRGHRVLRIVRKGGKASTEPLAPIVLHALDVSIADIRMPPTNTDDGLRAAIEIRRRWPHVGVLVLSQYVEDTLAMDLVERRGVLDHRARRAHPTEAGRTPARGAGSDHFPRRRRSYRARRASDVADRAPSGDAQGA